MTTYTVSFLRCAFTDVTDARCFKCRKKERKNHLYIDDEDECDLVYIAFAYTWVRIHSKVYSYRHHIYTFLFDITLKISAINLTELMRSLVFLCQLNTSSWYEIDHSIEYQNRHHNANLSNSNLPLTQTQYQWIHNFDTGRKWRSTISKNVDLQSNTQTNDKAVYVAFKWY